MTYEVRLSPGARHDLLRLSDFLVERHPRAATRAMSAIQAGLRSLIEHPSRGVQVGTSNLRELVVRFGRQGYVVQYRVEPSVVFVTRVFHALEAR